jgi:hypothetical protein
MADHDLLETSKQLLDSLRGKKLPDFVRRAMAEASAAVRSEEARRKVQGGPGNEPQRRDEGLRPVEHRYMGPQADPGPSYCSCGAVFDAKYEPRRRKLYREHAAEWRARDALDRARPITLDEIMAVLDWAERDQEECRSCCGDQDEEREARQNLRMIARARVFLRALFRVHVRPGPARVRVPEDAPENCPDCGADTLNEHFDGCGSGP